MRAIQNSRSRKINRSARVTADDRVVPLNVKFTIGRDESFESSINFGNGEQDIAAAVESSRRAFCSAGSDATPSHRATRFPVVFEHPSPISPPPLLHLLALLILLLLFRRPPLPFRRLLAALAGVGGR